MDLTFILLTSTTIGSIASAIFASLSFFKTRSVNLLLEIVKNDFLEQNFKLDLLQKQLENLPNLLNHSAQQIENSISKNIQSILIGQQNGFEIIFGQMNKQDGRIEKMREILDERLEGLQKENDAKLEKIRLTVEEKLHDTLEKRLGDSFKIVSERLEMVYQGLGEMRTLAAGVGDLKKVLSNVKTRGILGEVQLGNILEQFLTKEQYSENVLIKQGTQDRVEFTINLPGKDPQQKQVMLPIDAKFPLANYQRLVEAHDKCDKTLIELEEKAIEAAIKKAAKTIADKYIHPPITTDFGLMFIPIEGLYAEILRNPGLVEFVQREYKVIITGPTTLSAIVNSLQMGFRTLAIEKRSSDVWKVLDLVRKEFIKFADLLSKTKLKLDQASSTISDAETRSRLLKTRLDNFENKFNVTNQTPLTPGVLPLVDPDL
jgi:DNA recombination protein RmuC